MLFINFKDRSCNDIVCGVENSECFIPKDRNLPPSCRCIEGYSGDGVNGPCNIIPSKLKVIILNLVNNYSVAKT